jgi:tetratricopeptide (TPR) repeat protein
MKTSPGKNGIIVVAVVIVALGTMIVWFWFNQIYNVALLKDYLNDLRDVVSALIQIIALLLLACLVFVLVYWLSRSEDTTVLPFQNATGDVKYDGRAISDSLIAELQRIQQISVTKIKGMEFEIETVKLPALEPNNETVSASLADVATIGIGDTTVSVGKLLMTLKRMWPNEHAGSLITGSIQKYGSVYRLVARMEGGTEISTGTVPAAQDQTRQSNIEMESRIETPISAAQDQTRQSSAEIEDRKKIRTWTVTREIKQDSEITELIRELAYKIAHYSSKIDASSEGFERFSEAWNNYSTYKRTGNADDLVRAENECLEAHKQDQNYAKLAGLFYNFGQEELKRQDYERAKKVLEPATKLLATKWQVEKLKEAYFGLGYACGKLKDHDEAIEAYSKYCELEPKSPNARNNLGVEYLEIRKYDKASAEFEQAIRIHDNAIADDPESAGKHFNLGNVYLQQAQYEEAITEYNKAIGLDTKLAQPHIGLGNVYFQQAKYKEAITEYNKAIGLDPKFAAPHNNLGNVYWQQDQYKKAITEYNSAIDLDPKYALPHDGLGDVYYVKGRTEEALAKYERAIELDPKYATPYYGIGNVYYAKGRTKVALAKYERAIELDPKFALAHCSLVVCLRKLTRNDDAAEQIEIARELVAKENEYNRACFEAICGNGDKALDLLKAALEKKQAPRAWARRDPDFESLRSDRRFIALVGEAGENLSMDSAPSI